MSNKRTFISTLLISVLLLALAVGAGQAQGPQGNVGIQAALGTAFTYQGQLKSGGSPVNGNCDLQFSLWDAASGGTQIGATQTKSNVTVSDGIFTTSLDFGSAFTGDARWLEIAVRCPAGSGAYTTLSPRQALTAAPYALYAKGAPWSGLTGVPADFADGVDNGLTLPYSGGVSSSSSAFYVENTGSGLAIYGKSSSIGVRGEAPVYGVIGYASSSSGGTTYGVFGASASTSGRGVYGYASATSGTNYGVYGESASTSGYGVFGYTTGSGTTYGVYGESISTSGYGVYGYASATSGTNYGVRGASASTDGYGVYGEATATSGIT